jgi:hypothetical protein
VGRSLKKKDIMAVKTVTASRTRFRPSAHFKRAVKEVLVIPNCEQTFKSGGYATFESPLFYIRVLDNDEEVQIQLAERKTFDRWANSVNFVTERSKGRRHYYPHFQQQYDWAIKVLESKLFNFDSYFDHIALPWFEYGRNH